MESRLWRLEIGVVWSVSGSTECRPTDKALNLSFACESCGLEEKLLFGRLESLRYDLLASLAAW